MSRPAFPATPNRRRMPDRRNLERIAAEVAADDAALYDAALEDAFRLESCARDMRFRAEIERARSDVARAAEKGMRESLLEPGRRRNRLQFAEVMLWLSLLCSVVAGQLTPDLGLARGLALLALSLTFLALGGRALFRALAP